MEGLFKANQANDPRDIGRPPLPRCQWRRKSLEFASVDEGSSALPPSLISRHVDSHETTPCSNDGRFRGGAWGEHTQKYSPAAGLWEARSPQSRQSSESYWKIDSGSSVASWESEETDTASCRDAPWAKLGDLFITDRIGDIDADAHDLGAEGLPVSLPILPAATDSDDADSAKLLSAPSSPKVPDLPCAPAPAYDALALHHWLDDVRLSSIRGRTPKGSGSESSSLSYRERPPPGGDHDASGMLMLDPDALLGAGAPPEKPDPATWALRLRDQRSPPRHHSCCETNCDRILPETCRKASSAREQEIGRLERRLGPTSNERAFPHATAPGAALVPHESLFWPRLASVIAEAEAAEESQPGVIKRARSALALLLSGSEISTNGLRAHHIEALTLLLIPLELRAVGVSLSLRREHIALCTIVWMADPLDDATLHQLGFSWIVRLREDVTAIQDAAESVMSLFQRARQGTRAFLPDPSLVEMGLRSGRKWIGTNLTCEVRAYLLAHFDPKSGRALKPIVL